MNNKICHRINNFIKSRTSKGLRKAIGNLYSELILFKKDYFGRKKLKYFAGSNIKMNMGCGPNLKAGWINIDLDQGKCFNLDFRERFPFENGIASQIYSEHMLEHLAFPDEATYIYQRIVPTTIIWGSF